MSALSVATENQYLTQGKFRARIHLRRFDNQLAGADESPKNTAKACCNSTKARLAKAERAFYLG